MKKATVIALALSTWLAASPSTAGTTYSCDSFKLAPGVICTEWMAPVPENETAWVASALPRADVNDEGALFTTNGIEGPCPIAPYIGRIVRVDRTGIETVIASISPVCALPLEAAFPWSVAWVEHKQALLVVSYVSVPGEEFLRVWVVLLQGAL